MRRLLLIEDEDVIRRALLRFLVRRHFDVHDVPTIAAALDESGPGLHSFDVVLADLRLPDEPGTAIIPLVEPCPVVVMTSHASVRSAVDVMKAGATDYIAKPFDHDELLLVLERAMQRDRLGVRAAALARDLERLLPPSLRVAGTSLHTLAAALSGAADGGAPVGSQRLWVWGETGAGREAVARACHAMGARADGPLVAADLGNMPADARRRFPNSDDERDAPGLRAARNGTLLLRRVDLLDPDTQRALAARLREPSGPETAFTVIGDAPPGEYDPPLEPEFVALFSADDVARVESLDARRADVVTHAGHVLESITVRTGREPLTLAPDAADWLTARRWPGQVLELEQLVARAALAARGPVIEQRDLAGRDTAFDLAPDLEGYFRWFVVQHEQSLSETELAARLGISRKALWERRQRSGLVRGEDRED